MEPRKMTYQKRVELEEHDQDGYWIYLATGWQDSSNPGCHTIVEDTRTAARRKLAQSVRCSCDDCMTTRRGTDSR